MFGHSSSLSKTPSPSASGNKIADIDAIDEFPNTSNRAFVDETVIEISKPGTGITL